MTTVMYFSMAQFAKVSWKIPQHSFMNICIVECHSAHQMALTVLQLMEGSYYCMLGDMTALINFFVHITNEKHLQGATSFALVSPEPFL